MHGPGAYVTFKKMAGSTAIVLSILPRERCLEERTMGQESGNQALVLSQQFPWLLSAYAPVYQRAMPPWTIPPSREDVGTMRLGI